MFSTFQRTRGKEDLNKIANPQEQSGNWWGSTR